jgi:hypothetical protein
VDVVNAANSDVHTVPIEAKVEVDLLRVSLRGGLASVANRHLVDVGQARVVACRSSVEESAEFLPRRKGRNAVTKHLEPLG